MPAPSRPIQRALQLTQSQYAAGVALRSDVALARKPAERGAGAGDRPASAAQPARARDRDPDRQGAGRRSRWRAGRPLRRRDCRRACRRFRPALPSRAAGAPARYRRRRAPCGAGQRQHRRRPGGLFPGADARRASGGFNGAGLGSMVRRAEPGLVARRRRWRKRCSTAACAAPAATQALAAYDAAVAQYKQTVLGGFQEVEDNLAALRVLEQEARRAGRRR